MSILIAYSTKYGCTEKCAKRLSERLGEEAELYNLKSHKSIEPSDYDKVIIGGSIYIGKIQKEVSDFCLKYMDDLKNKRLGLFICGMQEGINIRKEINDSFPKELLSVAVAKEHFGGEFIFKKMNMMERFIVKKVSKVSTDTSKILEDNINKMAEVMNNA